MIAAAANGKAYGRKQDIPCKYLFPYDLVEQGDKEKVIKKGEVTREEYVLGLKRMEAQGPYKPPASLRQTGSPSPACVKVPPRPVRPGGPASTPLRSSALGPPPPCTLTCPDRPLQTPLGPRPPVAFEDLD